MSNSHLRCIRVHATNIRGLGALQLVRSLLPALDRADGYRLGTLYLPAQGELADYAPADTTTQIVQRNRFLPNSLSRILECTVLAYRFTGDGDLLVLGDIPLRCQGRQTVFVQSPLLSGANSRSRLGAIKYAISRGLFRLNAGFVSAFIVQTDAMKKSLSETYPEISSRIQVIGQPPPEWLLNAGLKRTGPVPRGYPGLDLVYPAASYPHKNHSLLAHIRSDEKAFWPIATLTLTMENTCHPNPGVHWIRCVGRLAPQDMLRIYEKVDALLFLSLSESFGFPLVEAMWIGLPIICPDLPYARTLCGDAAIYFDAESVSSLHAAVCELQQRLAKQWWPDWLEALAAIPDTWNSVALSMLQVTSGQTGSSVCPPQ